MTEFKVEASGLQFPEGPIAMRDGSILVVEIARGTLTRVFNGDISVIANLGGGPNGAAIGPDNSCYICNNGGFEWIKTKSGKLIPGEQSNTYSGGEIQKVDLGTGAVSSLYTHCKGEPLKGPNDIVFDKQGGFWFTDHGKTHSRSRDRTGVFYAKADGSEINEVIFPLEGPNGIGLSPKEDELYIAETPTGRLWAYEISEPGKVHITRRDKTDGGRLIEGPPGYYLYDSLALDKAGNICVATLINGGITILSPKGGAPNHIPLPDTLTTNICFGGEQLKTAFVTLSSTGKLISMPWATEGLPLNFLDK